jgi:hypothetical protein
VIRVVKRSLKLALEFVGVAAAGLSVLILLAVLRLSYGPVSIGFLAPYIESGLSSDDGATRVSIGDAVLTWAEGRRTLDIQLSELHVRDQDGNEQAFVPDLSVSFSLRALMSGRLAPTRLDLFEPSLTVIRRPDGSLAFGDSSAAPAAPSASTPMGYQPRLGGDLTGRVLSHLVGPPDREGPLGYLTTIRLLGADFTFDDQYDGIVVRAPGSDIALSRGRDGISGNARLNIVAGDRRSVVVLTGGFNAAEKSLDLAARFRGFMPSEFAGLAPVLAPFAMAAVPLNGEVQTRTTLDGRLTDVAVDLTAQAGQLKAPEYFDTPVDLRAASLKVRATEDLSRIVIESFTADFGGPRIALSGSATRRDGRIDVQLEAGAREVATADLRRLWPRGTAPGARDWVLANIEKGGVREMRLTTEITAREDETGNIVDIALAKLDGGFDFSGLDLHYLRPLPPVTGVAGRAKLSPTAIDFVTTAGRLGSLRVTEGKFRAYDLDTGIELLDLELVAAGPIADVIKVLEHPRLDLVKGLGIKSSAVKGTASTRLALKFPLRKDLKFDHMHIAAASNLRDVILPGVALGNDLTDGDMVLNLDKRGMDVAGTAKLGGVPATLKWTENFYDGAAILSRYAIKGVANDAARARFGLDFLAPYVMGPVAADLVITKIDKRRMSLTGALDVTDSALAFAELGWSKAAGVPGVTHLTLGIEDDKVKAIESLSIRAGDLKATGSITLGPDGKSIAGFRFSELVYGDSDLRARGTYRDDGGLVLDVTGRRADIRHFMKQKEDGQPKQPLDITVNLDSVRAAPNALIEQVSGSLSRNPVDWQRMQITGTVGKGTPLNMSIGLIDGVRQLRITCADAGAALKAFDITENVVGGTLNIEGRYDDSKPRHPLAGHFALRKFHMVRAPFMAKLLSFVSLTGILDMLSGNGIAFERADVPFVKTGDDLVLKDARAHGSAIGFTAEGRLDLDKDTMDLRGTVVPAYSLNSVFASVPLLGPLLVPEKGSGLFAATYFMRGPIDDPSVGGNPLATLTPGFLRGLFNIFDAPEKPKAPSQPAPGSVPPPSGATTPVPGTAPAPSNTTETPHEPAPSPPQTAPAPAPQP